MYNPELKNSTGELWRQFCRSEPAPRDGPVDWRAAYAVEKGVHKTLLKKAASRLTARTAVASSASRKVVLLDNAQADPRTTATSAGSNGQGAPRVPPKGPPSALQLLQRKVFPKASSHGAPRPARATAVHAPSRLSGPSKPSPRATPQPSLRECPRPLSREPASKLSVEAALGARPQLLPGHPRRPPGAPPPPKRPRLDSNGKLNLAGCGPVMRSAKLRAAPSPSRWAPPTAAASAAAKRGNSHQLSAPHVPSAQDSRNNYGPGTGSGSPGGSQEVSEAPQQLQEVDIF